MRPGDSAGRLRVAALLGALVLFAPGLVRPVAAEGPAPAGRAFVPVDETSWLGADGRLRTLYRPRFVPAGDLFADAKAFGMAGVDLALDPVRGRLLLTGGEDALGGAHEALAFLDVPRPQVLVRVGVVETIRRARRQSGGHVLFDRDEPAGTPNTLFRGIRFDFEPEDWLRTQVVGGRAFEGASVAFGSERDKGPLAGTLDAVLRGLAHSGEASYLAEPVLVCTEGVKASVEASVELPATVFTQVGTTVTDRSVTEKAGVRLEVTAERVGRDHVTLRVQPWLRAVVEERAPDGPESYPTLAIREIDARVTLADGDTVLVGGLETFRRGRSREGLSLGERLPALDGLLAATAREGEATEVLFLVYVRILVPGRDPAGMLPPSEAERLLHRAPRPPRSRARVVPVPPGR